MRVVKLKRFLVERSLFSLVLSLVFFPSGRQTENREIFFSFAGGKKTTHMRISRISTLFFNNNNTYYIYTNTHKRALFLSLDDDENTNKRRRNVFCSLRFLFEVYVFGAENDVSRSGNRVRTKRFFSLFVLRSETLITLWLLAAVSLFH